MEISSQQAKKASQDFHINAMKPYPLHLCGNLGTPSLPVGSRFSVLSSPFKAEAYLVCSSPAIKKFLPVFYKSLDSGEEGWIKVIRRRKTCSSLVRFCAGSNRCFKCGLLGHKKARCRFNGFCFRCNSPDHAVSICRFISLPLRLGDHQPKVMARLSLHCPIMIPPS